ALLGHHFQEYRSIDELPEIQEKEF
ncbi:hypothetical protein EVA_18999, partial [gut metagenome]